MLRPFAKGLEGRDIAFLDGGKEPGRVVPCSPRGGFGVLAAHSQGGPTKVTDQGTTDERLEKKKGYDVLGPRPRG